MKAPTDNQPHQQCHSYWWEERGSIFIRTPYWSGASEEFRNIDARRAWSSDRKAWRIPTRNTEKRMAVERRLGDPLRGMVRASVPAKQVILETKSGGGGSIRISETCYILANQYDDDARIVMHASSEGSLTMLTEYRKAGSWSAVMPRTLAERLNLAIIEDLSAAPRSSMPEPSEQPEAETKAPAAPAAPAARDEAGTPIQRILREMQAHNVRLIDIARAIQKKEESA